MSDVIISIPGATDVTVENAAASSVVVTFPASNNFVTTVIDRGVLYGIVGAQGPTGPQGATGPQGIPGIGIAAGGSIGQALVKTSATDYITGWLTLDKSAVGLSNVDNTSDLLKPISNATQTALNGKQALSTNLTSISALTFAALGFVKMTAAGTFALDTNTYLTAESDTLASVTGRGNVTTNAITVGAISSNKTATLTDTWANYQLVVGSLNQGGKIGFVRGDNGNINSFIGQDSASGSVLTMDGVNGVILKSNGTDVFFANASQTQIKAAFSTAIIQFKSATTTIAQFHSSTGNLVLQNGGTFTDAGFRLDVNGTARIQNQLTTTGSITAASAIARGVYMNQTLVAAANNDVLVGLDINPTFTNGAFTVNNYGLRVTGNIVPSADNLYSLGTSPLRFASVSGFQSIFTYYYAPSGQASYFGSSANTSINFPINNTVYARFHATTGNLTLQNGGTFTDAGFRLDVVGTARIQNVLTLGNLSSDPTGANGMIYYNTTSNVFRKYINGAWANL